MSIELIADPQRESISVGGGVAVAEKASNLYTPDSVEHHPKRPIARRMVTPATTWELPSITAVWNARELLFHLMSHNIRVRYAQSILGIGWAVVQPFFTMIIFTFFFGRIAGISSEGVPYALFSFAALVPWTYFAGAFSRASTALVTHSNIIGRVYFPRIVAVLEPVLGKLLDLIITLAFLFVLMAAFGVTPTVWALLLPTLVLLMLITALGLGLWLAPLAVQYRDVNHGLLVGLPMLLYATPVVFSVEIVPESLRLIYAVYPMVGVVAGFRAALLGTMPMPWDLLLVSSGSALCLLISGAFFFNRMEQFFDDVM